VLTSAIAAVSKEHSATRKMSDDAFMGWVVKTASVAGSPMVANPQLDNGRLKLDLNGESLAPAALNLDKFAKINDGLVARCGCDARTDVGVGANDLPAYVVRLDPETQRSEVLILLSGASIGPTVSMR
jgi:hypothetical protein